MTDAEEGPLARTANEVALPSRMARLLAFGSILVAGLCGGLIGYAFTDLQPGVDGVLLPGLGALAGAAIFAVGVAVVAVLALRAMTEWSSGERRGPATDRVRPE